MNRILKHSLGQALDKSEAKGLVSQDLGSMRASESWFLEHLTCRIIFCSYKIRVSLAPLLHFLLGNPGSCEAFVFQPQYPWALSVARPGRSMLSTPPLQQFPQAPCFHDVPLESIPLGIGLSSSLASLPCCGKGSSSLGEWRR